MTKRLLVLEDGTVFEGKAFGADIDVTGEIVFNTGMTGYQESITDQSYNGQILTFTYPLVGNYGINRDDYESIIPTCKGVVVFEEARRASNWRNQMTLDEFLKAKKIPGISGIDTRALTKIIRKHGTMRATLTHVGDSMDHVTDQLQATVLPTDNIKQVSTKTSYPAPGVGLSVVLVDFGLKHSILRELSKRNCNVTVVPYSTTAEEILTTDCITMVLTCKIHTSCSNFAYRMVKSTVTKFHLVSLSTIAIAKSWCPIQIPKIGIFPCTPRIISSACGTSSGLPGPFDNITPSGLRWRISSAVVE